MRRYFLWLLAIFGLIIVLIILIIPGGHKKSPPTTQKSLLSYSTSGAISRLTIDGPINANSLHKSVQISVGKDEVTFQQFTGYDGQVVTQQTFQNTVASYDAFLHALYFAGFILGNKNSTVTSPSGQCPLGSRYIFQLTEFGNDIENYWATSCGATKTYKGNTSLTLTLFQNQVPNYPVLTQNTSL